MKNRAITSLKYSLLMCLMVPYFSACGSSDSEGSDMSSVSATLGGMSAQTAAAIPNETSAGGLQGNMVAGGSEADGALSTSCAEQTDCAAGSGCDTASGVCVPRCSETGLCDRGRRCSAAGLCVESITCQAGTACPAGLSCDTCAGICVESSERQCERDGDLRCLNSRDRGYEYCDLCSGQCRPVVGLCEACTADAECGIGGVCSTRMANGTPLPGKCFKRCANDIACEVLGAGFACVDLSPSKKGCQPTSGECTPASACSMDAECPPDAYCEQGRCIQGCSEGGCPQGKVCQGLRCDDPCSETNPCPMGLVCEPTGLCKVENGCVTSADCSQAETYCDRQAQMCVAGCQVDLDCGDAAKECSAGRCVERGCAAAFQCGFGQVCDEASRQCIEAPGQHCMMGCDPESMAPCGAEGSQCLNLQDEDGNDLGAFCFEACGQEPNECPKGYGCQPLMDQAGNVMSRLCMRDCTIN